MCVTTMETQERTVRVMQDAYDGTLHHLDTAGWTSVSGRWYSSYQNMLMAKHGPQLYLGWDAARLANRQQKVAPGGKERK